MGYKEDIAKTFDESMEAARNVLASGSLISGGGISVSQGATLYASFARRALAYLIDNVLLCFVLIFVLNFIPSDIIDAIINILLPASEDVYSEMPDLDIGRTDIDAAMIAIIIIFIFSCIWIILSWLYFSILESSKWQATLGKKLVKLKVADKLGNRIGFMAANVRFWVRVISILFLFVGYLTVPLTKKRQALHDIIAGTAIVRVRHNVII